MNIPKKIVVGTREYSVEIVEAMLEKAEMGHINLTKQRIRIAEKSNVTGAAFTADQMLDTFFHEATHAILHDMGSRLYKNEKFVDGFSSRLTKIMTTKE